jgi:tRNA-splicing ligase RtcB
LWLAEARLSFDVQRNIDRLADSDDVQEVIILPDVHLGRGINNGCVAATSELVYPEAVGGDIGCGFSAIAFAGGAEVIEDPGNAREILRQIARHVPALKQRVRPPRPASLQQLTLSTAVLTRESGRGGAYQLGTLGAGNHFVELQRDDHGHAWLMVHSGSRGMGQVITHFHQAQAKKSATGLLYLDTRDAGGKAYVNDLQWALRYARLNRLAIVERVVEIIASVARLAADEDSYLDCPHNFVRRETHAGRELWVHRKSANSALAGERGLIAGSAGTPSFIVRGLGAAGSLCSSSHGAGRVLSRTEARQRVTAASLRQQLGQVQFDERQLNELRDEAPSVYRDIQKVLRAQHDLVRQETRLTPIVSFKHPDSRSRGPRRRRPA